MTPVDGIRKQFPTAKVTFTPGTKFLRYPVTIPASAYHTEDGKPGLTAVYFYNKTSPAPPAATRVEGPDRARRPAAGCSGPTDCRRASGTGDFSARWTGFLEGRRIEHATASPINGAGAVRVWLDGKLVDRRLGRAPCGGPFRLPVDPAVAAARSTVVTLEKGRDYALKVECFRDGAAGASGAGRPTGPGAAAAVRPDGPDALVAVRRHRTSTDAVAAAKQADVVIAVVGFTSEIEGEEMFGRTLPEGFVGGDRTSIDLPKDEQALAGSRQGHREAARGRADERQRVGVNWAHQHANAILEAWYPGEEGGTAIAETLAGVNNPAGRLPVTFYKSVNDLPPFDDYSMKGRTYRYFEGQPLYPFGFGLSYSTFAYSNARLSTLDAEGRRATCRWRSTSRTRAPCAGDEVVQAYLVFPKLPGAPLRALRGFQRVSIQPGADRSTCA